MTKPIARDAIYRRRRFEAEIIELCVRWYFTYRLSYRDLVAMMAERGLAVSHTTILRWVIRYVPEFEKRWGRWARDVHSSWRVDETYICVRGKRLSFARHWPPACRGGRARSRSTGTRQVIKRCGFCAGRIRSGSMFSSGTAAT